MGNSDETGRENMADLRGRRARHADRGVDEIGVAGYAIVREKIARSTMKCGGSTDVKKYLAAGYANDQQWLAGTELEQQVSWRIIDF